MMLKRILSVLDIFFCGLPEGEGSLEPIHHCDDADS